MTAPIRMSVGRDYETATRYEFVLFRGERVLARGGGYVSTYQARKAGYAKAAQLDQRDARAEARGFAMGQRAWREVRP